MLVMPRLMTEPVTVSKSGLETWPAHPQQIALPANAEHWRTNASAEMSLKPRAMLVMPH